MTAFSSFLELIGLAAVIVGAYFIDWRLSLVVGGVVAILVGLALDPPRRSPE